MFLSRAVAQYRQTAHVLFLPRRLYQEGARVAATSRIMSKKVEEVKFTDFSANYKNSLRAERWKKTPEFLNKPHLSGSLLTSGLAGKFNWFRIFRR